MSEDTLLESIPAYLTGDLSSDEAAAFEQALRNDPALAKETEAMGRTMALLQQAPALPPSPVLREQVMTAIEREKAAIPLWRALAAAACLVLVASLFLMPSPKPGPAAPSDSARGQACAWLARTQEKDGSWALDAYGGKKQLEIGVSGIALMAFAKEKLSEPAGRTARYLTSTQEGDGRFGEDNAFTMYNHGIATLGLLEARNTLQLKNLQQPIRKALGYLSSAQNEDGGWGYCKGKPSNTVVTAWQIHALVQAKKQGLLQDPAALARGLAFVRHAVGEDGTIAYQGETHRGARQSLSAIGASCLAQDPSAAGLQSRVMERLIRSPGPISSAVRSDPLLTWFLYKTAKSSDLPQLTRHLQVPWQAMEQRQVAMGPEKGSFPRETTPWGHIGGTVYTTAMMAVSLPDTL